MDAERLIELCEFAGVRVRSYSGRYMYGKHCVGISTDNSELGLLSEIAEQAEDNELRDLIELLSDSRSDSLGMGSIVYFPNIAWPDESEEDEDKADD